MDRIDQMTRAIGCDSDVDRAGLTGMSDRQWRRARSGGNLGADFVANLLVALRQYERTLAAKNLRPTFDELFEVVVVATGTEEAAAA